MNIENEDTSYVSPVVYTKDGRRRVTMESISDPFVFIHEVLGVEYLTQEQKRIVESVWVNKYTGVKAAHSVGKTFLAAAILLAYVVSNKDSIVVSTAPTERQVKDLLWKEVANLYSNAKCNLGGKLNTLSFVLGPKWYATGVSTDPGKESESAVRLQGYHSHKLLFILDEAVGIKPQIWEAIDGVTNSEDARILAIGNPSTVACRFKKNHDTKEWKGLTINALEHPNVKHKTEVVKGAVSYAWVKEKVGKWCQLTYKHNESLKTFEFEGNIYIPSGLFMWKVLGEFPGVSSDTLIAPAKVERSLVRSSVNSEELRTKSDEEGIPLYPPSKEGGLYIPNSEPLTTDHYPLNYRFLGVDVARFGTDSTVFASYVDNHMSLFTHYRFDIAELTDEAVKLIKKYQYTRVAVDCDGLGAGLYDNLKRLRDDCKIRNANGVVIDFEMVEIHSGSSPVDLGQTEEFMNLRAQMYWMFARDIEYMTLEYDEELEEEAGSIKYFFNEKGKIQIEPKDETKKRLGRSPDKLEGVIYANWCKYGYSDVTQVVIDDVDNKYVPLSKRMEVRAIIN